MVDEAGLGDDAIGIYNTDNINDPKKKTHRQHSYY